MQVDDVQPAAAESDEFSSELLTCPNEGCVKMYQRHSGLEKHLLFGQCKMVPERCTLLDAAKKKYHALLVEGSREAVSAALEQVDLSVSTNTLPEGWALKTTKKFHRFSDTRRNIWRTNLILARQQAKNRTPFM